MPPRAAAVDPVGADPLDAVLARVAGGDGASLAHLYDLTATPVHRLALSMVGGDGEVAADVVCAAYREIWSTAHGWEATALRPLSWVLSVCRDVGVSAAARGA